MQICRIKSTSSQLAEIQFTFIRQAMENLIEKHSYVICAFVVTTSIIHIPVVYKYS